MTLLYILAQKRLSHVKLSKILLHKQSHSITVNKQITIKHTNKKRIKAKSRSKMMNKNGHLEISASALTSEFQSNIVFYAAFRVKSYFYKFLSRVISIKVATYRFEACDFVRKCFAKISRRNLSNNFKKLP